MLPIRFSMNASPSERFRMSADFALRPIISEDELRTLHRMIITTFVGGADLAETLEPYHAAMRAMPDLPADARRGIFRSGQLICGCVVYARQLHIGHGLVPTACIGAVMTHPDYRGRGLAARLMRDVIEYATARGDGLLLLDGINDFYDRFGFVSVHNWTQFTFQLDEVLAGPRPERSLRPATVEDALALQARYRRHFEGYTGSFARTIEIQRHYVGRPAPWSALYLAENAAGETGGHILVSRREPVWSTEMTADDPATAVALLRFHAETAHSHAANAGPAEALHWLAPPQSELADWLTDRYETFVRTPVQPRGGWMARIADPHVLVQAMQPTWQASWLAGDVAWHGRLTLVVDELRHTLALGPDGVVPGGEAGEPGITVRLPQAVFTQLCFGYRPARWAAQQPDVQIPDGLLPVLDTLFPRRQTWVPGSDFF
jgi:GNAT superfamily N-acetyltransferase